MRSFMQINKMAARFASRALWAACLGGAAGLAGCAGDAPALPPDTTSVNSTIRSTNADFSSADLAFNCEQIAYEWTGNRNRIASDDRTIRLSQGPNQMALLVGGHVSLAYLAVDFNKAERENIDALYPRNDALIKLAAFKHCPAK